MLRQAGCQPALTPKNAISRTPILSSALGPTSAGSSHISNYALPLQPPRLAAVMPWRSQPGQIQMIRPMGPVRTKNHWRTLQQLGVHLSHERNQPHIG